MSAFDHPPMTGDIYEEEPAAVGDTFEELEVDDEPQDSEDE